MASWKKVIVSGSAAELSSLTLDTALPVAQGGIGATSITDKAVLISQDSGTDTVGSLALTGNGEIIVGGTSGPAVEAAADVAGTGLDASVGDGTLAINVAAAQTSITSVINSSLGKIGTAADQEYITFGTSNEVNTFVNNTERLSVTANGIDVTGTITNSGAVADSHITGSFTGSFIGDGTGLTGTGLDIDGLSALGGTGLHQTQDHFVFSDNGTEKKITFSNLEDAIFGNVSSDVTIAAGGAATIADDAVDNDKLANITRGSVKVGGASNAPTDLDAKGDGKILVGDGTDVASVAVSGDVTLANDGAVTIASDAVEGSMIHANAVDDSTLEQNGTQFRIKDAGVDENKLNSSVAGGGLTGGGGSVLAVGAGTGVTVNANDVAIGQSVATTANVTFATASITQDLTVGGDLTVNGTQTSVNTTNLLVEDRFILMNSGSASGDGGFIVQTESGFTGTALGWDDSAGRFGLQVGTKLAQNATAIAPDAYISSVVTSDDSNYQKNGNIRVQSGDIFIYVE